MDTKVRKWMPIALCCLPGIAVAVVIGISIALGGSTTTPSLGGPLGVGLIVLAALACPLTTYLMTTQQRGSSRNATPNTSQLMADRCPPGEEASSDHLESLRRSASRSNVKWMG